MPTTKTVVGNRAKETSVTAGSGTLTLAGAVSGFRSLVAAAQDASGDNTGPWEVAYCIFENASPPIWEMGIGTLTAGPPDTLARSSAKVESSTNGGSLVTFSGAQKDVFITFLAEQAYELFDKSQSAGYLKQTSNGTPSAPAKITVSRIATIPIADGGTGATSASVARTNLGLVIGTDIQAFNQKLKDIADLGVPADGAFLIGNGTTWITESGATARTSLGLGSMALLTTPTRLYTALGGDQAYTASAEVIVNGFNRLDFPGTKNNSNKYMMYGALWFTGGNNTTQFDVRVRIGSTGNGLTDNVVFRTQCVNPGNVAIVLEDAPDTNDRLTLTVSCGQNGTIEAEGTNLEIKEVID